MKKKEKTSVIRGKNQRKFLIVRREYFSYILEDFALFGKQSFLTTMPGEKPIKKPWWLTRNRQISDTFYINRQYVELAVRHLEILCEYLKKIMNETKNSNELETENLLSDYVEKLEGIDTKFKILFDLITHRRIKKIRDTKELVVLYTYSPAIFTHSGADGNLFSRFVKYHYRTHDIENARIMNALTRWGGNPPIVKDLTSIALKEREIRKYLNSVSNKLKKFISTLKIRNNKEIRRNTVYEWISTNVKKEYVEYLDAVPNVEKINVAEISNKILSQITGYAESTLEDKILRNARKLIKR